MLPLLIKSPARFDDSIFLQGIVYGIHHSDILDSCLSRQHFPKRNIEGHFTQRMLINFSATINNDLCLIKRVANSYFSFIKNKMFSASFISLLNVFLNSSLNSIPSTPPSLRSLLTLSMNSVKYSLASS